MRREFSDFLQGSDIHKHVEGQLTKGDSPLDLAGLDLKDPIDYSMDIYKVDGDLNVVVKVNYTVHTRCDRCLRPVEKAVESESHIVVTTNGEEEDDGNVLLVESLDEFPLAELVFSQVITSVPIKVLCDEDCRGLCPVCGEDLNEHPDHHCEVEDVSPFGSLKNLFDEKA
ncbi:MAG: DUF177 domain-containing protein [Peptoniphilus sp.]|nr:DUF177 domain-containing protein [Peptoniphilus sp.]MDY3119297.1 DUF177 domain-containing protein [Peptoniphilus sp.]